MVAGRQYERSKRPSVSNSLAAPDSILITGASSGIGAALAEAYAAPGTRLALAGRNEERLDAVAERCRQAGAGVTTRRIDVTDAAEMNGWIRESDAAAPLDLVIANAGVSAGTGEGAELPKQTGRILTTNVDGVVNTVLPAVDVMRPRARGQVAIMSSLAAFRGFPGAPAYCASKAAVRVWGEALRPQLKPAGIAVNVICPGFVRSAMTAVNDFPMPFLMDADKAAGVIRRGLAANRARIVFPWRLWAMIWVLAALPPGIGDRILARTPGKS